MLEKVVLKLYECLIVCCFLQIYKGQNQMCLDQRLSKTTSHFLPGSWTDCWMAMITG